MSKTRPDSSDPDTPDPSASDPSAPDGPKEARGKTPTRSGRAARAPVRDESDTFIDEVTEELQRDRMYALFRRYGPFAIGGIVAIVIGSAVWEYLRQAETSENRASGAMLAAAENADDPISALTGLADGDATVGAAALARFRAADLLFAQGDRNGAAALYAEIAATDGLGPEYRELATLRGAMMEAEDADPADLIARLSPLALPGAPYRPLALELQATAYLRQGDTRAAREALMDALAIQNAPQGLQARAGRLLQALGGPLIDPIAPGDDADDEAAAEEEADAPQSE